MSFRVDFTDDRAVLANIAWFKRRILPWLVLLAAACLTAGYVIGGPVLVFLLAGFAATTTTALTPVSDRWRLIAAVAASGLLWAAVHLHR